MRRRHPGFRYFLMFGLFSHLVSPVLCWNEIWCMWLERFRSCGFLSILNFPYTLTWDFTAHKTGSCFPIFTANDLNLSFPLLVVCAKFGEDRRRIADAIVCDRSHTYIQTDRRRRNQLAPPILLSTTFAILATW